MNKEQAKISRRKDDSIISEWGAYTRWNKLQADMEKFDRLHKIGKYRGTK